MLEWGLIRSVFTHLAVGVVIVEDAESDGGKDASKVEEAGGRQHFLRRLEAEDAVRVVGDVVR